MSMYPCRKCLENNWSFQKKRDFNEKEGFYIKWTIATCNICGDEIEFAFKKLGYKRKNGKPRFGTVAEYKIIDGKRFLKINGFFTEVVLTMNKKGHMRVMPLSKP